MPLLKRIPTIQGIIRRRLLVNYRADAGAVQRLLPAPFRPKLQNGFAIAGICLIRLEQLRPAGLPRLMGLSSENAAHRIAVEWTDSAGIEKEGVFIPRRDTDSTFNLMAGGRIFPGEHSPARFSVVDVNGQIEFSMRSLDDSVTVSLKGRDSDQLPAGSCFGSLAEVSAFFERGSVGYSVTRDHNRLDGLLLRTPDWRVRALSLTDVHSSFFADTNRFPKGSIEFDHALIMRNIPHQWQTVEDLHTS